MTGLPKYHLSEQRADALLAPVAATLRELEHRVDHYLDRLHIEPGDEETLRAALQALTAARTDVEARWRASAQRPQS
ncbi:MAG: hypothetical protein ACTHMR_22785 [Thermomicrobiales bacterium]